MKSRNRFVCEINRAYNIEKPDKEVDKTEKG